MIGEIMQHINNYFVDTAESGPFDIAVDGVVGTFSQVYVIGQYINIQGSKVNDGVYKLTGVSSSKLTVADTLTVEAAADCILYGLAVPKPFATLAADITTYASTASQGLTSESQGSRSVSYAEGSGWESSYKGRLNAYRRVIDDRDTYCRRYNIRTKA